MARFASRFLNYKHGVRSPREMVLADGQRQVLQTFLMAEFQPAPAILTEDEIKFATDNMTHQGLPVDTNTNQLFSPRHRISGFDSVEAQAENGWTDEDRELVEKTLRGSIHNGTDFVELPEAVVERPWATYDDASPARIVGLAKELGLPLERVLAYERQNQNRQAVVFLIEEALEAEKESQEVETADVVIEA